MAKLIAREAVHPEGRGKEFGGQLTRLCYSRYKGVGTDSPRERTVGKWRVWGALWWKSRLDEGEWPGKKLEK